MRTKDDVKEKLILEKALSMISKIGLSGLKMSLLAKEVGVATGTIYIYFKDKKDLIDNLCLFGQKETELSFENLPQDVPFEERFKAALSNYMSRVATHPEVQIFFEQYARSPYNEGDNDTIIAEEDKALKPLYELIETGQKEGYLKKSSTTLILIMLCGAVGELSVQLHTLRQRDRGMH
jgi:AcrR family transcriptional regulator